MLEQFQVLGLTQRTLKALHKKGFEEPTPVQKETIPLLLKSDIDIIVQAQTGTGKTAAFGLPLIEKLEEGSRHVKALVLVPTRELALQVAEEINSLRGESRLSIIAIYGGQSMEQQLRHLQRGVDIIVGTPGRVKDHLLRGSLNLKSISYAILDEADEMLNMGFIEDVEEILTYTNQTKRMLLFSATMSERILQLAKRYMKQYQIIQLAKQQLTVSLTDQIYFEVSASDKFEALSRIIDSESEFYGLVFCRTKVDVDGLVVKLIERGYDADGLHGDLSQFQREKILNKFRQKRINILVATDVAARGIDISDLTHVINYALPQDPESYVHRIGRTGRAGKQGTAITFITPDEYRKLSFIKRIAKTDIRKEKIPDVADIIQAKKQRIKKNIYGLLESVTSKEYLDFAQEILSDRNPQEVLAAFIKHTFGDELNTDNYKQIREVSVDREGTTRLFVAKGMLDNMNARKIVDMIKNIARIDQRAIQNVQVFDKFSFITVPFQEAEVILKAFQNQKGQRRSVVERAKDKNKRR